MSDIVIKAERLSKMYKLGIINNGTLFRDIQSWLALKCGKEDPHSRIGEDKSLGSDSEFWALKDLTFDIKKGDRVGIIGRNGAGKSTLLKILSRITTPTEGCVKIRGRISSLLEVGTGFHAELTGRENIYLNGAILGMKKKEIDRKLDEIIEFSEIEKHIDTPVKRYSSGMYVRLAFAVAAHLDSDILIADEVLAVGDAEFQKKAIGKMNDISTGQGRTVLFVSHNMAAVKSLCNKGIILEAGMLKFQSNSIDKAIEKYNSASGSNYFSSSDTILKEAQIYQLDKKIILEVKYCKQILPEPFLGFVVYNAMGLPVFGLNPRNITRDFVDDLETGTIKLENTEPQLLSSIYTVSLWLGDKSQDFEVYEKCLQLSLDYPIYLRYPADVGNIGNVLPHVTYLYS